MTNSKKLLLELAIADVEKWQKSITFREGCGYEFKHMDGEEVMYKNDQTILDALKLVLEFENAVDQARTELHMAACDLDWPPVKPYITPIRGKTCDCGRYISHCGKYDSYFCGTCDKWLEDHPVCDDKECQYCTLKRPNKPSEVKYNE
jgi:hypothetical protein